MAASLFISSISIILVEPSLPENIGAAARAMKNMGFSRLRLVCPENLDKHLTHPARRMSAGSEEILEKAQVYGSLNEALADLQVTVGCTARRSKGRHPILSPERLPESLRGYEDKMQIGIVFGREDRGLSNAELDLCHHIVTIPTAREHTSLNLAQAVLLICYELRMKLKRSAPKAGSRSALASAEEQEELYQHAREVLLRIGFLNPDNPDRILRVLRRITGRTGLDAREIRILRGILRQMDWYSKQINS